MTSSYVYGIKNSELIVKSTKNEKVMWEGKPKGYAVSQVLPIEDSNDCITLLDWRKTGLENQRNLLRLDPHGNIVWEVGNPPKGFVYGLERGIETESYTQIMYENRQLIASSYSGFADYINVETGQIYKSEFVK